MNEIPPSSPETSSRVIRRVQLEATTVKRRAVAPAPGLQAALKSRTTLLTKLKKKPEPVLNLHRKPVKEILPRRKNIVTSSSFSRERLQLSSRELSCGASGPNLCFIIPNKGRTKQSHHLLNLTLLASFSLSPFSQALIQ